jgi:hypothetical protein
MDGTAASGIIAAGKIRRTLLARSSEGQLLLRLYM